LFLGFRLGTILNLLALLWAAQIVDQILRKVISHSWLRRFGVLLIVLIESILFEISTYMVDILTLPLLLQATLLTLEEDESQNRRSNSVHIAFLLGLSLAFKLTNLAVVLPILGIHAYQLILGPRRIHFKKFAKTAALMFVTFVAPMLPFTIYIYSWTGNPVFPAANSFFQSPYWPTHGGWDDRWGPHGVWETIVWPVLVWFRPERHSELGVYSGRLSFGFVIALCGLIFLWRNSRVRLLCILLVSSALLWSALAMGYGRYGLFEDLLAGIVVITVSASLLARISWPAVSWRTAVAAALCTVLAAQAFVAGFYTLKFEWGGRNTLFANSLSYMDHAKLMLRDRSLKSYLSEEDRVRVDKVGVWLETGQKSTGVEALLNPGVPVVAIRQKEFFHTRESWRRFTETVNAFQGKNMYSLCLNADWPLAKQAIASRGLELGSVTPISVPFFSHTNVLGMMLIEVLLPQDPEARKNFETAWMKAAFAAADYRQEIVALNPPSVMRAGQKIEIQFKLKNLGSETWPATGDKDYRYLIDMGNHWIRNGVATEDARALLSSNLAPGAETELKMLITAPATPGEYTLEFDMVHEGVTWFRERGAKSLLLSVSVQP
jgi:hypothetical protein